MKLNLATDLDYDMRNQRFQTSEGFRSYFKQTIPLISDEYSFGNLYDYKTWHKLPNNMVTSLNIFGRTVNSLAGDDVRVTNEFFYLERNLKDLIQEILALLMQMTMLVVTMQRQLILILLYL